jgi:cell division protein FtsB
VKKRIFKFFSIILRSKIVALLFVLNLYFVVSLFMGKNDLISYFKLQQEIQLKTQELESIQSQKLAIKNKSQILKQENANEDQFDEILRSNMNVIKENEKIVLTK